MFVHTCETFQLSLCATVNVCVSAAPGETYVPLLTALLSVRPLWRTADRQTREGSDNPVGPETKPEGSYCQGPV